MHCFAAICSSLQRSLTSATLQVSQHGLAGFFGLGEPFKGRAADLDGAAARMDRTPRRHEAGASPVQAGTAAALITNHEGKAVETPYSATAAGNGIFGCRDRAPKTIAKMCERLQRQKSEKRVARNARRKALFDLVLETCGLRRLDGGVRSPMRTGLH